MSKGDFPDFERALEDFAFQYGLYSARFIDYVSAVIERLGDESHRQILLANLDEEKGGTHDVELPADVLASVVGQPHTRLYRRFQEALGVASDAREGTTRCPGRLWSQQFSRLCETTELAAIGAIGIGTELIVPRIFSQILEGLRAHSDLTMSERVFFELHSECDEQHGAALVGITEDLARDRSACEEIAEGMERALDMRAAFWDAMWERARSLPDTDFPSAGELAAVGYTEDL